MKWLGIRFHETSQNSYLMDYQIITVGYVITDNCRDTTTLSILAKTMLANKNSCIHVYHFHSSLLATSVLQMLQLIF